MFDGAAGLSGAGNGASEGFSGANAVGGGEAGASCGAAGANFGAAGAAIDFFSTGRLAAFGFCAGFAGMLAGGRIDGGVICIGACALTALAAQNAATATLLRRSPRIMAPAPARRGAASPR